MIFHFAILNNEESIRRICKQYNTVQILRSSAKGDECTTSPSVSPGKPHPVFSGEYSGWKVYYPQ